MSVLTSTILSILAQYALFYSQFTIQFSEGMRGSTDDIASQMEVELDGTAHQYMQVSADGDVRGELVQEETEDDIQQDIGVPAAVSGAEVGAAVETKKHSESELIAKLKEKQFREQQEHHQQEQGKQEQEQNQQSTAEEQEKPLSGLDENEAKAAADPTATTPKPKPKPKSVHVIRSSGHSTFHRSSTTTHKATYGE